jgi:peptide methionine sulfoxide reductase MsrB
MRSRSVMELSIRAEETFLGHVFDGGPIARYGRDHRADSPHMTVVALAESFAVAGERGGD